MAEIPGPFVLRSRLGQSELGESFLAERDGQVCGVVKRFTAEQSKDPSFRATLSTDLELAAKLKHPAISQVVEQGEQGGRAFVLLEYVDGATLARLIRSAQQEHAFPLPMARAVALVQPVLEALAAAHALSPPLLHRDLTPENILCTAEGRVVLTDFGLGRVRQRVGGAANLKRAYVSPEQARGLACDVRSEVFCVGLLLFELVCGRLPAQGGPGEVISHIATGELDSARAANPSLEDGADAVLARALAQRPEDRFASVKEFAAAVQPWAAAAAAQPLGAWVTPLLQVKPEPVLARVVAPVVPAPAPAPSPETTAPIATVRPPPSAAAPRRRSLRAAIAFAIAAFALSIPLTSFLKTEVIAPATRPLELTSIPSGATILVDNIAVGRTPATLQFAKNEMHHLTLRKGGFPSWEGIARNTSRIQVELVNGDHENELYDGEKPPGRPTPAPTPEPEPASPGHSMRAAPVLSDVVVYDVETVPVSQVLNRHHSVNVDETPGYEVPPDADVSPRGVGMIYQVPQRAMTNRIRTPNQTARLMAQFAGPISRPLALFGMLRTTDGVEAFSVARPVKLTHGGLLHFFAPTEGPGDQFNGGCSMTINRVTHDLQPTVLVRIDSDRSFRVRVLKPEQTYRLTLSRADGSDGPLPPVLMSLLPPATTSNAVAVESRLRVDGQPLEAQQALVSAGVHTVSGASTVVFVLPTLDGVVPADVALELVVAAKR